jgi:hypothetical protein
VLLAIAASISGVTNGFALDDVAIVANDPRVHSLGGIPAIFAQPYWTVEAGSSLYRPLTSVAFTLQWVLGGGSPLIFHVLSIVLYAAVSVAVFRLARLFIDARTAWLAAALFAVHPLHVEAVANVVGQAELWAALFALCAVIRFARRDEDGSRSRRDVIAVAALFGTALLFKEHVIVLPAILVVAEWLHFGRKNSRADRLQSLLPVAVITAATATAFLVVRTAVLGGFQGGGASPIFFETDLGTRVFTMLAVVQEWLRLFVWPAELSADYSPSRIVIMRSFGAFMLPGLLVLGSATVLGIAARKTQPVLSFALAWIGITLLIPSNLVVVTGFVLAERGLFLASVGVTLIGAMAITSTMQMAGRHAHEKEPALIAIAAALLLMLGIARSSTRNPVWYDNESLITQTVEDAPQSARAHMMMAQLHIDRGQLRLALAESAQAVELGMDKDPQVFAFAADVAQMNDMCGVAMKLYSTSLALRPDQPLVRRNASICMAKLRVTSLVPGVSPGAIDGFN